MSDSINRKQLAKVLQSSLNEFHPQVRLVDCDVALDTLITYLTSCVVNGVEVRVSRFGKLSRKFKPARTCNDPRHPGSTLLTEAKYVAQFVPFGELQEAVRVGIESAPSMVEEEPES